MRLVEIKDLGLPELDPFRALTSSGSREKELIIAESPKVIERALDAGYEPVSLLLERKHLEGDASSLISRMKDACIYTGERDILAQLTGYTLTRGVLCAMKRPVLPSPLEILDTANRICVIYDVCDTTNIGVIFRTAAALGYDGVIVSHQSCDPFNRRAVRVSMGAVFQIPWTFSHNVMTELEKTGFKSVSMALTDESVWLQDFIPTTAERYAVILGSEGYGLPESLIADSSHVVKIPMHHCVDSLNVGAAAAIALWHFR